MNRLCSLGLVLWVATVSLGAMEVPAGFDLQILEPTGGKIAKPKEWFYAEQHHGPVYVWVLSKEDSRKEPYLTGLKIQVFSGVKKGTGKSSKEFCLTFLDSKRTSTKVISASPESAQYLFTRQCLEVEEEVLINAKRGLYHINYSVFWSENSDLAVITIAGAPVEVWPEYQEVFQVMSKFELIDMKRFEKEGQSQSLP